MQLRHLARTPAPFARDDLIEILVLWVGTHDKGLKHTALSQGRVHGVSVSTLAALLTDDVFLRWFGLNRHVSMEVVPQQVWVAREVFETGLHAVPHFDFALACSCVDTPEGGKLYVERSVEHACWPRLVLLPIARSLLICLGGAGLFPNTR